MDWSAKQEVKKGNLGEKYARQFLEEKGFIVYKPITDGAHKIDYFAHSGKDKRVIALDAKTKKRRARYCDTGFNHSNYLHYLELNQKYGIKSYLYFVDDFEGCIYGQWLDKLSVGKIENGIIYWHLKEMEQPIRWLTPEEIQELKENSTPCKYDYTYTERFFKQESLSVFK